MSPDIITNNIESGGFIHYFTSYMMIRIKQPNVFPVVTKLKHDVLRNTMRSTVSRHNRNTPIVSYVFLSITVDYRCPNIKKLKYLKRQLFTTRTLYIML